MYQIEHERKTFTITDRGVLNLSFQGLADEDIAAIFDSLNKKQRLAILELNLNDNDLSSVPDSIGTLKNLHSLSLHNNRLEALPSGIGDLPCLVRLYLYNNRLPELPETIGKLSTLEILSLNNNRLITLPDSISGCVSLQELYVTDNLLVALPESIAQLEASLWKLYLFNNPFISAMRSQFTTLEAAPALQLGRSLKQPGLKYLCSPGRHPIATDDLWREGFCKTVIENVRSSVLFPIEAPEGCYYSVPIARLCCPMHYSELFPAI